MASRLVLFYSILYHCRDVCGNNAGLDNGEGEIKMGDISEMRGLIVVGSFLAVTLLMINWIPSEFQQVGDMGRTITAPSYFESSELINWNVTYTMSITSDSYSKHWGKSEFGHDMMFRAEKLATYNMLWNEHGYTFLGFWTGGHKQEWINDDGITRGTTLTNGEIDLDWNTQNNLSSYILKCAHFYMMADVGYNTTLYSNSKDAWDNHDLHVLFGIEWSQRGTTWDAWSLMANLLFFQLPEINIFINALIAIPIWVCVGYLSFIFVLRTLGAIFGGGGA